MEKIQKGFLVKKPAYVYRKNSGAMHRKLG